MGRDRDTIEYLACSSNDTELTNSLMEHAHAHPAIGGGPLSKEETKVKWKALASAFLMEATAGTSYAFGLYSEELKKHLGFTQSQIEFVGTAGNIGLWTAVEGGVLYDSNGPFTTILVGLVFNLIGYLLLYGGSISTGSVLSSPAMMAVAMAIGSHGSAYISTTAVSTNVRNFGPDKGKALGLLKAFLGLSASMLASVYSLVFRPHVDQFLLFQALLIPGLLILSLIIGHELTSSTDIEDAQTRSATQKKLALGYVFISVLAVYVLTTSVLLQQKIIPKRWEWLIGSIGLIVGLTVYFGYSRSHTGFTRLADTDLTAETTNNTNVITIPLEVFDEMRNRIGPFADLEVRMTFCTRLKDKIYGMGKYFKDWKFYMLFATLFAILGSGITVINNVGSLVKSLDSHSDNAGVFVTVVSVGNCFGRIVTGFISDKIAKRHSRAYIIAADALLMSSAMLVFSMIRSISLLYIPCFIAGFAYGGLWPLWLALLSDLWGESNFGALVTLLALAPASASVILNQQMSSRIYQAHTETSSNDCYGHECYQMTFFILLALSLLATCLMIILGKIHGTSIALRNAQLEQNISKDSEPHYDTALEINDDVAFLDKPKSGTIDSNYR